MASATQELRHEINHSETASNAETNQILERLIALRTREGDSKRALISIRIEQGHELKRLQAAAGRGQWLKLLSQTGFHESTAQRLMKVADSWLGKSILTTGQGLLERLPLDLQKLAKLASLTDDFVRELLVAGADFEEMSRGELSQMVDAKLLAKAKNELRVDDAGRDEIYEAGVPSSHPRATQTEDSLAAPPSLPSLTSSPGPVAAVPEAVASYATCCRQLAALKAAVLAEIAMGAQELRYEIQNATELGTEVLAAVLLQLKTS